MTFLGLWFIWVNNFALSSKMLDYEDLVSLVVLVKCKPVWPQNTMLLTETQTNSDENITDPTSWCAINVTKNISSSWRIIPFRWLKFVGLRKWKEADILIGSFYPVYILLWWSENCTNITKRILECLHQGTFSSHKEKLKGRKTSSKPVKPVLNEVQIVTAQCSLSFFGPALSKFSVFV